MKALKLPAAEGLNSLAADV